MEVPYKLEVIALTTIIIKLGVSVFPYSGKNQPPKFGDYEAQRHWMEITLMVQHLLGFYLNGGAKLDRDGVRLDTASFPH
ncbi:hypothetical protein OUZ56_017728 [Daphnia magna]|uniref:Alpha-1,3-glucosyltransferase n=1 Tax=Daphnia magna TaxID=35525 RepID=A0ABR0ATM5_9CRUS|nr:hypothetical protein OUZ56_017728 [Daphnia magna]